MIGPKVAKPSPAQSKRAYQRVAERSFGLCEGCGHARASQMHHRKYRSRGGLDEVANLLHLCAGVVGGNVDGCHGRAHTQEGEDDGWSLPSGVTPAHELVLYRGNWVYLLPDGGLDPWNEVEF